jgi:asparagine synthase (glutamine-hydrolysing)
MCGISGEYRFDQQPPNPGIIQQINRAQQQRGPDSDGIFCQNQIALGHTRLMIMDLSPHSQQPMVDSTLGLTIVFNGAIYNHEALRQELQGLGYRFFSSGDTEVILKAFHAWGPDCLQRFNGMFAFAIRERDSERLFIARDRLGIKPFYYVHNARFFRFASTLTALLHTPDVDRQIDPAALNYYLNFHSVVPAPHTLFRDIRKLPPGHCGWLNPDGQLDLLCWWKLSYQTCPGDDAKTAQDWQQELLQQLRAAVKRRNVAAVDVGVLLSGGVDSSLLTGLLAEIKSAPIQTFSIGFETVANEVGDEFRYSDLIADTYGTRHYKIRIPSADLRSALPDAIASMSEPMVSHDCVAFYLLAKEVRKHCRAVQSGQGADEVFGGYHWYPPLQNSTQPFDSYRQAFFDRSYEEYCATVQPGFQTSDLAGEFVRDHFARCQTPDAVSKALHLDTTVMLVEDPVKRVDNMTMAASLEARVPFLDHELVEFAARIPSQLKVRSFQPP